MEPCVPNIGKMKTYAGNTAPIEGSESLEAAAMVFTKEAESAGDIIATNVDVHWTFEGLNPEESAKKTLGPEHDR